MRDNLASFRAHNDDLSPSQLAALAARVIKYNQLRIVRTEQGLSPVGLRLFRLLAPLLHYNHPDLPGFISHDTPSGIANFHTSSDQIALLDELLSSAGSVSAAWLRDPSEQQILGLYSMGSTSSIGQSENSDLDIWVCHHCNLGQQAQQRLRQKCDILTAWAAEQGMEVNFFLVNPLQFRQGQRQTLSEDNCGSAQQWLLLDEFYRSAMCLAGRQLAWYLVPPAHEQHYAQIIEQLFNSGQLNRNEWLDMGGFDCVPAEEYFGATLWQLYKGIDSPYKSVLKTLLLEAYSAAYPQTYLLALELKQAFHNDHGNASPLLLDSYYLMLNRVESYLTAIRDFERRDLARRCFYLKVAERLSEAPHQPSWRHQVMRQLVSDWGWSQSKINHLDRRGQWKVEHVRSAYKELLDTQMLSFRKLIQFARSNNITESINAEDLGVLSRKLHAAFETNHSKINLINPQISPDLHEQELTLVEVIKGRNVSAGWYLYKVPLVTDRMLGAQPQKHGQTMSKLIAWAHFNGILTEESELYLYSQHSEVSIRTLHQFCKDLRQSLPIERPQPSKEALSNPAYIQRLAVFVNLENDPTGEWRGRVLDFDARSSDVLRFGPDQSMLIESVDIVYQNSWNELHVFSFRGDEALLDALLTVGNKMNRLSPMPECIEVFCYSDHFSNQIRRRVSELFRKTIAYRVLEGGKKNHLLVVPVGRRRFGLLFEARGVSKQEIERTVDFYSKLSTVKLNGTSVRLDNCDQCDAPSLVESHASEGLIQFFFERTQRGLNIYVVDEDNRVEAYQDYSGRLDDLVQNVNRYYTSARDRFSDEVNLVNFNLPQFYELVMRGGELDVIPYGTRLPETKLPKIF